jgi:hypothetical protein
LNPIKFLILAPGLLLLSSLMVGQTPASTPTAVEVGAPSPGRNLYLKVQLSGKLKPSSLRTGDVIEGVLAQPVYSGPHEYLAASSRVRLTVDKLERRKRTRNNHWPWVVQVFTPRHENYPTFQSAVVSLPDGREVPLQVSLISIANKVAVHVDTKSGQNEKGEAGPAKAQKAPPGLLMTLQANTLGDDLKVATAEPVRFPAATLATGTGAKIILLDGVSASKSLPGDAFQARLVEPVRVGTAVVLPEGTIFQGKVVRSKRPRWLSRSGSLLLTFTGVTLPGSSAGNPIVASVTGAELDPASHTKIDSEGELKGSPGKAWMLANIAATGGIAKVADDGIQLLVEALSSTATDASTAGTGRIVALCASGVFMITRHGRDVMLPQFTEMNIVLDRPVSLNLPRSQAE